MLAAALAWNRGLRAINAAMSVVFRRSDGSRYDAAHIRLSHLLLLLAEHLLLIPTVAVRFTLLVYLRDELDHVLGVDSTAGLRCHGGVATAILAGRCEALRPMPPLAKDLRRAVFIDGGVVAKHHHVWRRQAIHATILWFVWTALAERAASLAAFALGGLVVVCRHGHHRVLLLHWTLGGRPVVERCRVWPTECIADDLLL